VVGLGLRPDNSAASKAFDEGPEDGRMGVLVAVLDEDVFDGLDIRNAENVMVLQEEKKKKSGPCARLCHR